MTIVFWILWVAIVLLNLAVLVWTVVHLYRCICDWFSVRTGEICFRKGRSPEIVPIRIMCVTRRGGELCIRKQRIH